MAKKNKNKRRGPQAKAQAPPLPKKRDNKPSKYGGQGTRETVEQLVIAFVLAMLFRTFQAEAFVIPTGSMAPTLMGRHEDVWCDQCGQRFKVSDSLLESGQIADIKDGYWKRQRMKLTDKDVVEIKEAVVGKCPCCRYLMPLEKPLRKNSFRPNDVEREPAYSGDRILVNKFIYDFVEPSRWDVVVFKYPGNGTRNFIKRLVGLPGEELKIEHGDVFVRALEDTSAAFTIARKPPDKMLQLRQVVYDTDHSPATLHKAGYPLRWRSDEGGWKVDDEIDGNLVRLKYSVTPETPEAWVRYHHIPPDETVWGRALSKSPPNSLAEQPQLVTDFNAYNATATGENLFDGKTPEVQYYNQGMHWVGDLYVDADVKVESGTGELTLELVEAGCRFQCRIDVATGKATLAAIPFGEESPNSDFSDSAATSVKGPGQYKLRLANVDDQLTLWVGSEVVKFENDGAYDVEKLFGNRQAVIPKTSAEDPGDLAPAAIGASNLKASINRLAVYRDIYYIADKESPSVPSYRRPLNQISDFRLNLSRDGLTFENGANDVSLRELNKDPSKWQAYTQRRTQTFSIYPETYFVMGDNSAASSDARLWSNPAAKEPAGGAYLVKSMMIGRATCVYWPHTFNRVPGTPIPFPFFPNVGDMRLVK